MGSKFGVNILQINTFFFPNNNSMFTRYGHILQFNITFVLPSKGKSILFFIQVYTQDSLHFLETFFINYHDYSRSIYLKFGVEEEDVFVLIFDSHGINLITNFTFDFLEVIVGDVVVLFYLRLSHYPLLYATHMSWISCRTFA